MVSLAHTAHWQFLGLVTGCVGWLLTMVASGLSSWRLWHVSDASVVTSGVASVGIWRACFHTQALPAPEACRGMGTADGFVPVEISVAQVLMMAAVVLGLAANVAASFAVRNVYFSVENRDHTGTVFSLAGALYVVTAACSALPLLWNMSSVLTNRTIDFPPEFLLPPAPAEQEVGTAIGVGLCACAFILASALLFLCYRLPRPARLPTAQPTREDKESAHHASQPIREDQESAHHASQPIREDEESAHHASQPIREDEESARHASQPIREDEESARHASQPIREDEESARHASQPIREDQESARHASQPGTQMASQRSTSQNRGSGLHQARDNPAFLTDEHL